MNEILMYMLKAAIIQCFLLVCYRMLMHSDTFHRMVRFYFLGGMIFSYITPLIRFDFRILPPLQNVPQISRTVFIQDISVGNPVVETPELAWWTQLSVADILTIMLIAGMIIMLVRFVIQYLSLGFLNISKQQKYKTYSILNTDAPIKPFSFGKRIYINPKLHNATELEEIIRHELIHVHQYHSIDIIVATINRSIFWWNPFALILSKDIRNNLEYIVDSEMLKHGFDRKHYQYHLLNISQLAYSNGMANYFNFSNLKKRIEMMNKEKTQSIHKMKWLLLIPVAALILISFNVKRAIATNVVFTENSEMIEPEPLNDVSDTVADKKTVIGYGTEKKDTIEVKKTVRKNEVSIVVGYETDKKARLIIDGTEAEIKELPSDTEIESVTVLKNEAAIKQFGEKGKNGVIIIQNKSGENLILYADSLKGSVSDFNVRKIDKVRSIDDTFNVRGLEGNPLIIIDDKESDEKALQELKSTDIESVAVLKNDAATKVYGDKGKNGVIIIETKKYTPVKGKLEVFNRFGNRLVSTDDSENWDGTINTGKDKGTKLPEGAYVFTKTSDSGLVEKGSLSVDKSGKLTYVADE